MNRLVDQKTGVICFLAVLLPVAMAVSQDELSKSSSWQTVTPNRIRSWVNQVAGSSNLELGQFPSLEEMLEDDSKLTDFPLLTIGKVISQFFPSTADLIRVVQHRGATERIASQVMDLHALEDSNIPATARQHLRLLVGRCLAQNDFFDEALMVLSPLGTNDVLDPASLLFYRGLCQHRLLEKQSCVKSLRQLLENEEQIPKRFAIVSNLMLSDIEPLEENSLDEISRLMDDIRRRQALYRSGTQVLGLEEKVIEKLDKLIEEIEKQLQNAQQMGPNQVNPANPMKDSQNAGGKGQGNVDNRRLTEGGSWGNLPPKQRAAALAEMVKDLPPHYREVIEEYFRQLAKEPQNDR